MADDVHVPAGARPGPSLNRDEMCDVPVETESSPPSNADLRTSLRADYVPAVVEWDGPDNDDGNNNNNNNGGRRRHYIGASTSNPVALLLHHDSSSKALVFRLRIIIALRGSGSGSWKAKAPVYLCIRPESLRRLAHDATEQPPAQYTGRLGHDLRSLRVDLLSAAGLTVPDWPLAAQNPAHGRVLDAAKLLAVHRTFTVHVRQSPALPPASLDALCAAVTRRELRSSPSSGDPRTLFEGRRHASSRVVGRDDIAGTPAPAPERVQTLSGAPARGDGQDQTGPPSSPPSYDTIDPPPPMAPLDRNAPKRKRRSSSRSNSGTRSDAAGAAGAGSDLELSVEQLCRKIVADELSHTQQRVDSLEHQVARLERERDDAVRLAEELRQQLRSEEDRLDDRIGDKVWLEVDELRTSLYMDMDDLQGDLKAEMRDYVREQVEEQIGEQADRVAEEVHTRLATAQVNILEGRLEIQYQNG